MLLRFSLLLLLFAVFQSVFADDKPNVLLVLTDDQGWGDVAFNGNSVVSTPNIDSLFTRGVSFERFYVSPVCSPTRASLLTGRHSLATGVFSVTRGGEKMPTSEITLAEYLKSAGYRTGLFGKWHNGLQYPYNPMGQGFDTFYGFADGHTTRYVDSVVQHNHQFEPYKGYLPNLLTEQAMHFMADNTQPFFAYLSFNTPHSPFVLPNKYFDKYKKMGQSDLDASIYGMVENIDWNLGRVFAQLKKSKQLDNTIIIFLSDNGPAFPHGHHRYNGNMKGWKGKVNEGGVRVPFAIWWPGHIEGGKQIKQPAQHIDVVPTLTSLLNIATPTLHGVDLSALLMKSHNIKPTTPSLGNRLLFTHHFHNTTRPSQTAIQKSPAAVRDNQWLATLDNNNTWQLYDLINDPNQQVDLAKAQPNKVNEFANAYSQWFNQTTRTHGPYTPLPIEIGHSVAPITEFPAHEASINQEGLDYFHHAGWSHDWLTAITKNKTSKQSGTATWPIKIVTAGEYAVEILYSTPQGAFDGDVNIAINTSSEKQTLITTNIKNHVAQQVDSTRRYETGEAAELTWARHRIAKAAFKKGEGSVSVSYTTDKNGNDLYIKAIEITKLEK